MELVINAHYEDLAVSAVENFYHYLIELGQGIDIVCDADTGMITGYFEDAV